MKQKPDTTHSQAGEPATIELADDRPETLLRHFEAQGWGDGLPMVAPTEDRVAAMLAGLGGGGSPDEVVATLPPRSGLATPRLIAINAVLAGCAPAQMPVLVAAVEALGHPRLNLRGVNATTHPVAPLVIVHGEAARLGGFNGGAGAFGPGNRANATTGRAVRLILNHVAGAAIGSGDASTQGGPAKYSYCVAENIEESPWGSLATSVDVVSRAHEPSDADGPAPVSAVTVHCGEAPHNVHDMESADPAAILNKVASTMASLGSNHGPISQAEFFVALCPEHAATCADAGWSRSDVAAYLFQRARLPAGEVRAAFALRAWAPWLNAVPDNELLPMTEHPDNIRIFVVGGPGKHSSVIPSWGMTRSVTVPVASNPGSKPDTAPPTDPPQGA